MKAYKPMPSSPAACFSPWLSFNNLSSDQCNDYVLVSRKSFALDTVGIRFIGGPRILADAISLQSMIDQGIWSGHLVKRKSLILYSKQFSISLGKTRRLIRVNPKYLLSPVFIRQ